MAIGRDLSWAALAVAVLWPRLAAADAARVKVELSGPPSCIDQAAFRGDLSRLPASTLSVDAPRSASVRIVQHGAMYTGLLQVVLADGATTLRQVASDRCREVTDALELVAALALGLEALPEPHPQPLSAGPYPQPLSASGEGSTRLSSPLSVHGEGPGVRSSPDGEGPAVRSSAEPAVRSSAEPAVRSSAEPAVKSASRWAIVGGLEGALLAGMSPGVAVNPEVAVGVWNDSSGVVAPAFELRAGPSTSGTGTSTGGVSTTVTLTQAALAVCPIRLALGAGFAFRPCAEVSAGALSGTATGQRVTGSGQQQAWLAATPVLRLEFNGIKYVQLELNGGPTFPILHDQFFLNPSQAGVSTVYGVPDVAAVVRLGAIVHYP